MARDDREPVLAEGRIEATSRLLRDVLAELDRGLEEADHQTRRKASWLVAGLLDHWSRHKPPPNEGMRLHVERTPSRVRIAATVNERVMPSEDWERLGQTVATGVADEWGVETQGPAVAWFDMRVSRPAMASPSEALA